MLVMTPDETSIINIEKFAYIHACKINTTHVDFYYEVPKRDRKGHVKRGTPDFIVELPTMEERDSWFKKLMLIKG